MASRKMPRTQLDVSALQIADSATTTQLKTAAGIGIAAPAARRAPRAKPAAAPKAIAPGKERWSVKTGTDPDASKVRQAVVDTTVEELHDIARPRGMTDVTKLAPAFSRKRADPVEVTIWQVDAHITLVKLEQDGDLHVVLQGASGRTIVAESPTPRPPFVGATSPWRSAMSDVRKALTDKFKNVVPTAPLIPDAQGRLVPQTALPAAARAGSPAVPPQPLGTMIESATPFMTRVDPVHARVTGVGFFDKVHGQAGVSTVNGIELHPILKIEFL
jgi:hypothetical protein